MSLLFDPFSIGDLEIKNRFMRSATTTYFADADGMLSDGALDIYENLTRGEVGLIVKGHLCVVSEGLIHQGMARISSDKHIPRLKELTDRVHQHEGKIIAQINHGGIRDRKNRVGPSEFVGDDWSARALDEDEIQSIIESFSKAAERAVIAGFDGVQLHGAHGYLISQFLSSTVNRRTDDYGGSLNNRMRLLEETYDAVRARVGNFPVMLKMNCDDFAENGFTIDESIIVAGKMTKRGIDLIEISGGGVGQKKELYNRGKHSDSKLSELSFAGHAAKIRENTFDTPIALVEGFSTIQVMESVIRRGITDLVSMSRPLIREPDLVQKLKAGQDDVSCIRCDACSGPDVFGKTLLRCQLE